MSRDDRTGLGFLEIFYAFVVIMIPHLFVVRYICVLLSKYIYCFCNL